MTDSIYNHGERFVPWIQGLTRLHHYSRYHFAIDLTKDKNILDIACGEGYGSAIIAEKAKNVVAVDISDEVITHARSKYSNVKNLSFVIGSVDQIPIRDHEVEVVVSFETLEHVRFQEKMMSEIKRVLKEDGLLVLSTPDKSNYLSETQEINHYHVKELNLSELKLLISQYFKNSVYFKQAIAVSSGIFPETGTVEGKLICDLENDKENKHTYNLVIASDADIPPLKCFAFSSVREAESLLSIGKGIYSSKTYKLGYLLSTPYRIFCNVFGK